MNINRFLKLFLLTIYFNTKQRKHLKHFEIKLFSFLHKYNFSTTKQKQIFISKNVKDINNQMVGY